jgi:hypothetical protein
MTMAKKEHLPPATRSLTRRTWTAVLCCAGGALSLACGSGSDGSPDQSQDSMTAMPNMPAMPDAMSTSDGMMTTPPMTGNTNEDPANGEQTDPGGLTGNEDPMNPGGNGSTDEEDPMETDPPDPVPPDPRPFFSFFVTSQAGLFGLPAGEFAPAPDPALGYGGNLGGLAGADEICTMLARSSNPGDNKTWRAFLSTSGFDGGESVDAIDRIGPGPWFNYNGLKLADDIAGLLPEGDDGRPQAADPQLAEMFTDENGENSRPSQQIDNHDTLTGSGPDGRLFDDGADGEVATCQDWTSSTLRGAQGNIMGGGGQVPVGHMWPRNAQNGRQWIQDHTINGCEPGFDIDGGGGAPNGDFRVGAGGGYGAIYCFALGAIPPEG